MLQPVNSWVDRRWHHCITAVMNVEARRKICAPSGNRTTAVKSVASHFTELTILADVCMNVCVCVCV
jgi:hypothetical protein